MNKPLILVVEDDATVRNLITTTLKSNDYRYITASNGEAAIMAATTQQPDIVFLDLGLPDLDGVENFLTNTKEGYCVQFASAAALILREYGIPTRYVEGYIACDFNTNSSIDRVARSATYVHDYEAHAWIEVFFDGIGWVQYECTPAYYAGMYGGMGSSESEE